MLKPNWKRDGLFVRALIALVLCGGLALAAYANPLAPLDADPPDDPPYTPAAQVCFFQQGTYGGITVTESGAGCGNFLTFGGITGVWMGDSNVDESCEFTISPPVSGVTASVPFTAHSCVGGNCEKVRFRLNGSDYNVQAADIDDANPPGGDEPIVLLPSGEVEGAPVGTGDGRATVTFNNGPASLSTIEIVHDITAGSANGTIYLVCVDDQPASVPAESDWNIALIGVTLLAALGLLAGLRHRATQLRA